PLKSKARIELVPVLSIGSPALGMKAETADGDVVRRLRKTAARRNYGCDNSFFHFPPPQKRNAYPQAEST
ncbi:MAG: hypothetical protein WCA45_06270, partial [Thiobacillaceae bacterium]